LCSCSSERLAFIRAETDCLLPGAPAGRDAVACLRLAPTCGEVVLEVAAVVLGLLCAAAPTLRTAIELKLRIRKAQLVSKIAASTRHPMEGGLPTEALDEPVARVGYRRDRAHSGEVLHDLYNTYRNH
jgi:hypothetical protein